MKQKKLKFGVLAVSLFFCSTWVRAQGTEVIIGDEKIVVIPSEKAAYEGYSDDDLKAIAKNDSQKVCDIRKKESKLIFVELGDIYPSQEDGILTKVVENGDSGPVLTEKSLKFFHPYIFVTRPQPTPGECFEVHRDIEKLKNTLDIIAYCSIRTAMKSNWLWALDESWMIRTIDATVLGAALYKVNIFSEDINNMV